MNMLVLILIGGMIGVTAFLFGYMWSESRVKRMNKETDDRSDAQYSGEEVSEQEWTGKEIEKIDLEVKKRMNGIGDENE